MGSETAPTLTPLAPTSDRQRSTVAPLLIPLTDVPAALSISRAHLARLRVAGKFGPVVLRSGRKLLVRVDELRRWVDAGMQPANVWRAMEEQEQRRRMRAV
jgi:hypothetical protein